MKYQEAKPTAPTAPLDAALQSARSVWAADAVQRGDVEHLARLEMSVVAQMRAAKERSLLAVTAPQTSSHNLRAWFVVMRSRWHAFANTRFFPAAAGSVATLAVLAVTAPWWLQLARESYEVATPFMLVSQPQSQQLDVAQMVRVNVSREAMLDFGIPVPPQQLGESVKAEMLMGARGDVLAVRFVEPTPGKRWRWQMN